MADAKDAKKEAAPAVGKAAPKKKGGGMVGFILLMICLGASFIPLLPTYLLLVGMFPTLVALFIDTDPHKSSAQAVGTMNAAGVAPFVIELWQKGQTMEHSLYILSQPETWLVMLGAAALGQLILFAVPHAIASMALARAEARLGILKGNLEKLKAIWGPDVSTTKSLNKIMHEEKE